MKILDVLTAPWAIEPAKLLDKRSLAKESGHTHYYTGKACTQGHIAQRRTSNGGCQTCLSERSTAWLAKNIKKGRAATALWRTTNRETLLKTRKAYRQSAEGKTTLATQRASLYKKNPEKFQKAGRDFYQAHREQCADRHRRYCQSIPGFDSERGAKRRASLLQAMPFWADRAAIKRIYAGCPVGMHVDHFVPLHGLVPGGMPVRGLHVPGNLRYLSASANSSRKNRMSVAEVAELECIA